MDTPSLENDSCSAPVREFLKEAKMGGLLQRVIRNRLERIGTGEGPIYGYPSVSPSVSLQGSFIWDDTPEGHYFWVIVKNTLKLFEDIQPKQDASIPKTILVALEEMAKEIAPWDDAPEQNTARAEPEVVTPPKRRITLPKK